jgi:hypothetical protein
VNWNRISTMLNNIAARKCRSAMSRPDAPRMAAPSGRPSTSARLATAISPPPDASRRQRPGKHWSPPVARAHYRSPPPKSCRTSCLLGIHRGAALYKTLTRSGPERRLGWPRGKGGKPARKRL